MRKPAICEGFQRGNRSADVELGTGSGGDANSGADVDKHGANNRTATTTDIGTGNVVCHNQTVDQQLPPRIQTPCGQLTHTSDSRLAQLRLQSVTHRTNPTSRSQSRWFASHSNTNCSRIVGGSNGQ